MEENYDEINWHYLSFNDSDEAIALMREDPDEVVYDFLLSNKNIYEIDIKKIELKEEFIEELVSTCFNPKRVKYYLEKYNYNIVSDENNFL